MVRFGCVILVDRRGWVLLQERDEHPEFDPEKWSLCGGHLEEGESFHAGALRELEEETGVRLASGTLRLWRELQVFHEAYGTLDTTQVYVAGVDLTDADIVVGEGRQIVFVEPATARTLDLTTSATTAVPDFLDSAEYHDILGA